MARLPLRLDNDPTSGVHSVEIAPAIQKCLRTSRRCRIAWRVAQSVQSVCGVLIVLLIGFVDLSQGSSSANRILTFSVAILAFLAALALTLAHTYDFQHEAYRHGSAARALERIRDRYTLETAATSDGMSRNRLCFWAKSNVTGIERLLDDARVRDVDLYYTATVVPVADETPRTKL